MVDGSGRAHPRAPYATRARSQSPTIFAVAAALCLAAQTAFAGDLADVKARGKIVMLSFPVQETHFVSVNLDAMREQGLKFADLRKPEHFKGIDIDLMSGFAAKLGVSLEIHPVLGGYGALIPALLAREGDFVASEFTITPTRRTKVDFSTPYVSSWVAVVVPRTSAIAATSDLAGKRGAGLKGSSHLEFLQAIAPKATPVPTSFDLESLEAVGNGSADFALMDTRIAPGEPVDTIHPDLKIGFRLCDIGDGVAVRPGSDLLPALDAYLAAAKESGELQRILERHAVGLLGDSAKPKQ
jgi:ABC-type amino acid transport substrate-binding protein